MLRWLGMQEGEAIESGMVTRRIEKAQKKVEEWHFDSRKNLLEYDEVMDHQRKQRLRQAAGDPRREEPAAPKSSFMIRDQIEKATAKFLDPDYGPASFAEFASNRLGVDFDARDFRGDFEEASKEALEKAISDRADRDPGTDRGEPQPGRGPEGLEMERTDASHERQVRPQARRERPEEDRHRKR